MKRKKLIAIALLIGSVVTINGTIAWLFHSAAVSNTFTPAKVEGSIDEKFDNQIKENVKVTNTSDIPTYIRVALVPTWMDGENATALETEGTYTISFNLNNWFEGSDGFYYYKYPVAPNTATEVLVNQCFPNTNLDEAYKGKQFNLEVIASLIQAEPDEAVINAWGVSVDTEGCISK